MIVIASQITGNSTVYSNIRLGKHQKACVTYVCEENQPVTDGFRSQRASNAESGFMAWCHHVIMLGETHECICTKSESIVWFVLKCVEAGSWAGSFSGRWTKVHHYVYVYILHIMSHDECTHQIWNQFPEQFTQKFSEAASQIKGKEIRIQQSMIKS